MVSSLVIPVVFVVSLEVLLKSGAVVSAEAVVVWSELSPTVVGRVAPILPPVTVGMSALSSAVETVLPND